MTVFICQVDGPTCNSKYKRGRVTYYCRLKPGHEGEHDCPADRDDRGER